MPSRLIPVFFISGVAGLMFETLWFRLAGLSLGNSVWSASLVLAAFMGGLTLGNGLVARYHSRIAQPIRLYALLELAIGGASLLVVLALPRLSDALGPLFTSVADTPWLLNLARLGSAFVLLVLPTSAMGATLPLLTEALSRANANFGTALGKLYGWNTLGAMLGAISTEVAFVRFLGITSTGLFAMLLNFAAGMIALRLAAEPSAPLARSIPAPAFSAKAYRYLLAALLSGATMLALEVVWFRFLLLTYLGTALTFALMLAIVLAGIGLGGLLAGWFADRTERCHRLLPHAMALSGFLVVATYSGFDLFSALLARESASLPVFIGLAVFLTLPVSVLSGLTFTFIAHAVKQELGGSIRTTGIVALWNTIGATAGALAAGFLLLPMLGMERSLFALAAVYCATALLVPAMSASEHQLTVRSARASIAVALVALALFPFGLMERSFFRIVESGLPHETLVATREGLTETMRYYRSDAFGSSRFYRLVTNGYSMSATSVIAKRYMKLYVYLPIALQADARDALLISYGVGSTAKALTDSPGLRHIDIVDISREILEMSSVIYADDNNPLRDPRVEVHVEDGRFFLGTHTRKYDLITSEPPPPKVAGVVNLYTEEYFRAIREHLTPTGRTSYWLPVHQLEPLDTLAIIKAFCNVFEDCSLWDGAGLEWMLVGGNGALQSVSLHDFTAQWRDARVSRELVALGFELPEQLGALFMGDARYLAALTADIPPVTDNHPLRISSHLVGSPGYVPLYAAVMDEGERLARFQQSTFIERVWPHDLRARAPEHFRYEGLIKDHFTRGLYPPSERAFKLEALDEVLSETSLETLPLWLLGSDWDVQQNALELAQQIDTAHDSELERELALGYLAQRDYVGALQAMERSVVAAGGNASVDDTSLLLYLLAKNGKFDAARALIASLDATQHPALGSFIRWFDAKFGAQADTLPASALR